MQEFTTPCDIVVNGLDNWICVRFAKLLPVSWASHGSCRWTSVDPLSSFSSVSPLCGPFSKENLSIKKAFAEVLGRLVYQHRLSSLVCATAVTALLHLALVHLMKWRRTKFAVVASCLPPLGLLSMVLIRLGNKIKGER